MGVMDIIVSGAYGRDYTSLADAKKDWEANKDFRLHGMHRGSYINKADYEKYGKGEQVWVRFNQLADKERLT